MQATLLSPVYVQRLQEALANLTRWLACSNLVLGHDSRADLVNIWLVDYVQYLHDGHGTLAEATHAILVVQRQYRKLRGRLGPAWDSIRSWKVHSHTSMRVPFTLPLLRCCFVACLRKGLLENIARRHLWIPLGVALLVGFDALLRPAELFNLKRADVVLPTDQLFGYDAKAVVIIRDPKTKSAMGRNQFGLVSDRVALGWLTWLCDGLPPALKLFPSGAQVGRTLLTSALADLGLGYTGLTLGSLRTGGATHKYIAGTPVDRLRFEGRWKSNATLEHYIQEAASYNVLSALDSGAATSMHAWTHTANVLLEPPSVHWSELFSRSRQLLAISAAACRQRHAPCRG